MTEQLKQNAGRLVELVRELQGRKCFCGAKKIALQTFCHKDYFALPKPMRDALYDQEGYMEAYDAARKYLKEREK